MSGWLFIAIGSLPFLASLGWQLYNSAREDFEEFKGEMLVIGLVILFATGACLMCYGVAILAANLGGR